MEVYKAIVGVLSSARVTNSCMACATKQQNETILRSFGQESWVMADTGACSHCGEINDVFCDEMIKLQIASGITAEEWLEKYPRIVGGWYTVRELYSQIHALETLVELHEQGMNKQNESANRPFWKKLLRIG
jgi:hypothetical protein